MRSTFAVASPARTDIGDQIEREAMRERACHREARMNVAAALGRNLFALHCSRRSPRPEMI
jgi:hypothetical protein